MYMRQAYYVALSFLGNHDDALDASQEAFAKAHAAMRSFDASRRFFTWYYAILRNHCLNMIRRRQTSPIPFSMIEADLAKQALAQSGTEEAVDRSETRSIVWKAIWRLEPDDRQLIVARDIVGTSYVVLAELLDIPMGTVMSRLYHARRRLRGALEGLL
jgi:RNA polymerase sigma-70 factor (ECF subfamily)